MSVCVLLLHLAHMRLIGARCYYVCRPIFVFFFQDLLQILFNRNYMHIKYHQNPTIISYIRHRQHQSKRGYSYEVQ